LTCLGREKKKSNNKRNTRSKKYKKKYIFVHKNCGLVNGPDSLAPAECVCVWIPAPPRWQNFFTHKPHQTYKSVEGEPTTCEEGGRRKKEVVGGCVRRAPPAYIYLHLSTYTTYLPNVYTYSTITLAVGRPLCCALALCVTSLAFFIKSVDLLLPAIFPYLTAFFYID
jgi:hypothetical protein